MMETQIQASPSGMKSRRVLTGFRLCSSLSIVATVLLGASCGGSSKALPAPQGLPALTIAGPSNSYLGTQSPVEQWQVSVDHTSNSFSAADLTNSSGGTVLGSIVNQIGFLGLAQTNVSPPFQPFGFALEIPGRALLLRPGINTAPLAALVPGSCLNIDGNVTFQFVTLPGTNWQVATDTAYGKVQASANGSAWNFSNFTQFTLGNSSQIGATLTTGACATNATGGLVTIPPNPPSNVPATLGVGPSGFLVANQFLSTASGIPSGAAGVIQPSTSVSTSSVVGSNYLGFIYEPNVTASPTSCSADCLAPTQMAAFSGSLTTCQTLPSSSGMCGGAFFNDSLTNVKQSSTDTTIELGSEDPGNFGLYKSATVTIPDPAGSSGACTPPAVVGTDSQNSPTCTLPAIAVVGDAENRFAIFMIAQDKVNNSPLVIILFQDPSSAPAMFGQTLPRNKHRWYRAAIRRFSLVR
jgi:hypothetical protein